MSNRLRGARLLLARMFADRGADRNDYSDKGFWRLGYAAVDDYCSSVAPPFHRPGERRQWYSPAKTVRRNSFSRRIHRRERRIGDARRRYEEEAADASASVSENRNDEQESRVEFKQRLQLEEFHNE